MTFKVEVDARFVFEDGGVHLDANGQRYDLSKLETAEEWRLALYGIAMGALQPIAGNIKQEHTQESPTAAPSSGDALGDVFQRQRTAFDQSAAQLLRTVQDQHNRLREMHEESVDAVTKPSRTTSGSE